ncbi:transglycosylase SLT domain-containing protein [Flammeovirga aprica]|uniref:Lytic transglycosylase domain-containing protein n=1 Tax=Flammeovirga aprica JL-4 TaxID=694437 RepID=A0A7X9RUQ1_9BACT|nr:transglycosylase SLT domain-containing protein [Flammeovirga aprica]NME68979.1 lytic transglycosylase domain-containing protein [Flammeovirga aprica JL-4]
MQTKLSSLLIILLLTFQSIASFAQIPNSFVLLGSNVELTTKGKAKVLLKYNSLKRDESNYRLLKARCVKYFPAIESELKKQGVPAEFVFLPLLESQLDGEATSNATPPAVGFWQLKSFTAEDKGLIINNKIDERKDIRKSSMAGALYLSKNNYYLSSWFYTLISYHDGLSGAKSFIKKNKLNYFSQVVIDENTHPYVIHFISYYFAFKDVLKKQPKSITKISNAQLEYDKALNQRKIKNYDESINLLVKVIEKYCNVLKKRYSFFSELISI